MRLRADQVRLKEEQGENQCLDQQVGVCQLSLWLCRKGEPTNTEQETECERTFREQSMERRQQPWLLAAVEVELRTHRGQRRTGGLRWKK